jgi:hypothetical protein
LKYNAPASKALPSLSTDGSDVLEPRYLSSKLSKADNVWSLAASAAVCADAADVAELDAFVAEVEAELAELAALVADVLAALAEVEALVA